VTTLPPVPATPAQPGPAESAMATPAPPSTPIGGAEPAQVPAMTSAAITIAPAAGMTRPSAPLMMQSSTVVIPRPAPVLGQIIPIDRLQSASSLPTVPQTPSEVVAYTSIVTHTGIDQVFRVPSADTPLASFIIPSRIPTLSPIIARLTDTHSLSHVIRTDTRIDTSSVAPRNGSVPDSPPIAPPSAPLLAPQTSSSVGSGGHGLTFLLLLATLGLAALIGRRRIRDPAVALPQRQYKPPVSPG
jgi:hypothetical protein